MSNRAWRAESKKKPQQRETQKEPQKQERKTLQETCKEMVVSIAQARREKAEAASRERHRIEEDEQMLLAYGPNWRTKPMDNNPTEAKEPPQEEEYEEYQEYQKKVS